MGRSLIIVGASARAAAFSAARAGFEPYAIDLFADRDLAELCPAVRIEHYPLGFLRALAESPQAPWTYTGGLENYPRLVSQMAAIRPLLGNSARTLRGVRSPRFLSAMLREEGFSFPREWTGRDVADGRWLVKPRRSSGGLGVSFATREDFAAPPRGAILQEYIAGQCASAAFVAAGGRAVLLGATKQLIGRDWGISPEFIYVGSLGPLDVTGSERAELARLGEALARRIGLVGLFGVDFIHTGERLWPVEVNPRFTASMEVLERITGQQFVGFHVAACQRSELPGPLPVPDGPCVGKAVMYARGDCSWARECPSKFRESHLITWPDIADVPHLGQSFRAGQPIATVFATGDSTDDIERKLRQREAALLAAVASPQPADMTG
jgi:Predicted ATP-dependent carboligase related to biotin carboxylase